MPGVAIKVTVEPSQATGLLTETVGFVFTVAKTGTLAEVHPLDVTSA